MTRAWQTAGGPGVALVVAMTLAGAGPGAAQPVTLRPGEVVERIRVAADSTRSYALFLPTAYTDERVWPILFVLDPRGRAVAALERFRLAADELGWIVASSYDSRSDVPEDRNTPALSAMLDDTQRRIRVDPRRLYLAGFSGTAEASWHLALALPGHVAGIVAAGFGLPSVVRFRLQYADTAADFAVYGTAGRVGFNYEDVVVLDAALGDLGLAHRVDYFDGGHAWMPDTLAAAGLRWLELRAMRDGRRPVDEGFVERERLALERRAEALAAEGWVWEAVSLLDDGRGDFGRGIGRLDALRQRLAGSETYRAQVERRQRDSREATDYSRRLRDRFGGGPGDRPRVAPDRLADELGLDELLDRAAGADSADALQARRLLGSAAVLLSFYGPRAALDQGRPGIALDYVETAERIRPGAPELCRFRALAAAELGRLDEAVEAVACWIEQSAPTVEVLLSEARLDPLRGDARFEALLEELARSRDGGHRRLAASPGAGALAGRRPIPPHGKDRDVDRVP